MKAYKFDKSIEFFKRVGNVIPGGIYGQRHPAFMVPGYFPILHQREKDIGSGMLMDRNILTICAGLDQ